MLVRWLSGDLTDFVNFEKQIETLNSHVPIDDGSDWCETLPKRVSDNVQCLIVQFQYKLLELFGCMVLYCEKQACGTHSAGSQVGSTYVAFRCFLVAAPACLPQTCTYSAAWAFEFFAFT